MEKHKIKSLLMASFIALQVFVASQISYWNAPMVSAQTVETTPVPTPAIDEEAVKDTQNDISDLQKELNKQQKAKDKLQQSLGQIQQSVSITQKAINSTKSAITETDNNLTKKEQEIKNLNDQVLLQQELLKNLVQQSYYIQNQPILNLILSDMDFSGIFGDNQHLTSLDEKIFTIIEDINAKKVQIDGDKAELAKKKEEHLDALKEKTQQKNELVADQIDVQVDIEKKEATIGELQDKLNELKSDLSNLLGKNLSTKDIVEAAGIASSATGVRKDFILGELVVETNLGTFTGGCTYKNTRMREADKTAFKALMKELGYDVNSKKISCSPGYGYGGAMGVAQFMPTTWTGYKSYIAGATGHNPPDPWNIIDGVMGMAKKLANGGATSKSGEKLASKRYYCGGPSSPYWKTKCETYASNVQYWADNYEKKL